MGGAGQGFARGFLGMQQIQQQRQELEQRKKEADLRGKLIDLQMQQIQQKIASGEALREVLGATEVTPRAGTALDLEANPEAAGITPPTRPKPIDLRSLALGLARTDPDSAVKLLLESEKQGRALESSGRATDLFTKLIRSGGGAAGAAPTTAIGAVPEAAPSGQPSAPSGIAPSMSLVPTLSFDKEGNVSLSIAGKPTQFNLSHQTVVGPDGRAQVFETVFDPTSGRVINRYPVGPPAPPEAMQRIEAAVESLGVARTSAIFGRIVGQVSMAMLLPPDVQAQRLAAIEAEVGALPPNVRTGTTAAPTTAAAGGAVSGAISAAQQHKVETVGKETRERERAQREEQPIQGADRTKLEMLQSVERQAGEVRRLFRPEFVGKGFRAFGGQLKKEYEQQEKLAQSGKYTPGGIAGAVRKFFGQISPEEVEFRSALLDISDLLLRARSGAQINEQEYQRLKAILPDILDEPNVFIPALRRFSTEAGSQIDDVLKLTTTGAKQLREERERGKSPVSRPPAPKTSPPPGFRRERP